MVQKQRSASTPNFFRGGAGAGRAESENKMLCNEQLMRKEVGSRGNIIDGLATSIRSADFCHIFTVVFVRRRVFLARLIHCVIRYNLCGKIRAMTVAVDANRRINQTKDAKYFWL